jgi:hypothetical protein
LGFFSGSVVASTLAIATVSVAQARGIELELPKQDVLSKIDLELPDELPSLSDFKPHRGPVVVYLDRDGGRVEAGRDNATKMRSGVVERNAMSHVDIPAYRGSDRAWNRFVGCVESQFSEFEVVIVDDRPTGPDYMTVMVGGDPKAFDFEKTVGGIAPYDGTVIHNAFVFVFETPHQNTQVMCETAAHEIGHALGLDHTRLCTDVMSYERCGEKSFQYDAAACGEWSDRTCSNGRDVQSSWSLLADHVGIYQEK